MTDQFYVEGKRGALVPVNSETYGNKVVVSAESERLTEATFRRALKENWPGVDFMIYKERHYWKGESI